MSQNLPSKILVVDDDQQVAQGLEEPLQRYNVKVDNATSAETAFYLFNTSRYDVVLLEIEYGPLPGLALVQKWRAHDVKDKRSTAFIMLNGNKSLGTNEGLIKELGDLEILNKPFGVVQVLPFLSRGLATKKRLAAYQEMKERVVDYYEKTRDLGKATEQVKARLAELGPKGLNLMYELYERGGKFDEALAVVTPMLERDPQNITLLNAKGRLLMRLGRFADAKVCLEKSDELAPQNIERLNEMATAFLHLKDPDQSVKKFREILDLSPERPEMKFDMFAKLYEHGFDTHAVQFGKETAKPMEIVRHYNNKGVMLSKEGQKQQALLEYTRALRFFPQFKENYRIYYNIGLAQLQKKTPESYVEAQKALKRCLELSPDFDKAKSALEIVDKALGKQNKAS